jgi:hypothetical protein
MLNRANHWVNIYSGYQKDDNQRILEKTYHFGSGPNHQGLWVRGAVCIHPHNSANIKRITKIGNKFFISVARISIPKLNRFNIQGIVPR